jgi:hypothetical protein
MNTRVSELINLLDLDTYPEGGHYRETFRSPGIVQIPGNLEERRALTTIYYLLLEGEYDSWHRLSGDEVWHYLEGSTLELFWIRQDAETCTRCLVGNVEGSSRPVAVVPGGCWQMARITGDYTLVGCTMGPGFEKEDYRLLRDMPEEARKIRLRFPELADYI